MPHARPGKEWLHLRDAICMGDTKAVVDVLVGEGIPDLTYDEMDEMLIGLKHGGTDACAVVTEQEFKFAINNMIAQATAVDPMASFVTERWDRVFNDMVGRASGRIPSSPSHYSRDERRTFRNYTNVLADEHHFSHHADQDERGKNFQETITGGPLRDDFIRRHTRPGAHEPGHQQTWQEALMDARRWAETKNQYALVYIDSLLSGQVEERTAEYAAMGFPGTDRASAIRTQLLYVLNNLASWRGEEARAAKATLRAVSKGDLPAHYTRETPQGALESMEERLTQDSQFTRRITQETLNAALTQMELRVGEIAEAIRQMGTQAVPAPVVAQIQEAAEAIEEAAEQVSGRTRGRTPNPQTVAIRNYALSLGQGLSGVDSGDIVLAIRPQFPDVTGPEVLSALSASWRTANKLPNLKRARATAEPPPPPAVIPVEPMEGGELDDLLGGLERPQRQLRNGGSWSRKYYPGLTEAQHDVNDAWFEAMLEMLNPGGILGVPNIQKAFNKQGEEVPFPPQPGNPPNRVTEDPPN